MFGMQHYFMTNVFFFSLLKIKTLFLELYVFQSPESQVPMYKI